MASSPRRSELYRRTAQAVIAVALGLTLAQLGLAQVTPKKAPPKGPRATGLLQLMPNGQAHLIPIVILIDGKYYDAGSYKASPVPMALESGTVYEAFRTGVSEGLFTVTQVRQLKDNFIADGHWHLGPAEPEKKVGATPSKPILDEDSGPPKLRRSGSTAESAPAQPAPSAPPQSVPKAPSESASTNAPTPAPSASTVENSAPEAAESTAPEDPNRPILHRGKATPASSKQQNSSSGTPAALPVAKTKRPASNDNSPAAVQWIPAISDAHGPDSHPYNYEMKPDEEQKFRTKMLALAGDEIRSRDKQLASETIEPARKHAPVSRARHAWKSAKPPQPSFEDVQLRVFDLSNSNEPTLILTASARMPQSSNGASDREYFITLVARNDIYNELHKGFSNVTDSQHLDVVSRLDLIDAVDVDGDTRGELLFRESSDSGQGYVIYRVIGDQLYPLYQSNAGQ